MSGFRGVMKDGWHPKGKSGAKESWRGDFKGINQVAGWMGKGKDKDSAAEEHVSRPLASLKDPSTFGPPPKRVGTQGSVAGAVKTTPDRRGLGAPLSQEEIQHQTMRQQQQLEQEQAELEESQRPAGPALPYRANTTGLNTEHLPAPPIRRMDSPANSISSASSRPVPSVPPRIPPRMNSSTSSHSANPPPPYSPVEQAADGFINQGAVSRLSNAGVSVPALGIGQDRSGPGNAPQATTPGLAGQPPVHELQTRFSQLRTSSSHSSPAPASPTRGNASPGGTISSPAVSQTSAQGARATVHDSRDRHSDKLQAGKDRVHDFNDKYKISQRFTSFVNEKRSANTSISSKQFQSAPVLPPHPNRSQPSSSESVNLASAVQRKGPPPPPPPKKAAMRSTRVNNASSPSSPVPPPLPLSTKPR